MIADAKRVDGAASQASTECALSAPGWVLEKPVTCPFSLDILSCGFIHGQVRSGDSFAKHRVALSV
jgi:hypothetical protein